MTSVPRPSATVCLLHQGDEGIEVLMVRRSPSARFMGGAWVFPGGAVEERDHDEAERLLTGDVALELRPWLVAGLRELAEETGVWLTEPPYFGDADRTDVYGEAISRGLRLDGSRSAYFANWITPSMSPIRFDARFFLVELVVPVEPRPDGQEITEAMFVVPAVALRRAAAGEWLLPVPTRRALELLSGFATVDDALRAWRDREVVTIQPRLRIAADGSLEILLPGEAGFDELSDGPADPEALARAARASARKGEKVAEVVTDAD